MSPNPIPSSSGEFKRKNDYSVTAYMGSKKVNSMAYVHKINVYTKYLEEKNIEWSVINVYARRTSRFIKRFYKNKDIIPERVEL